MCAQRDEFDQNSLDQFAREITAGVDVARILSATLTHSDKLFSQHSAQMRVMSTGLNLWTKQNLRDLFLVKVCF